MVGLRLKGNLVGVVINLVHLRRKRLSKATSWLVMTLGVVVLALCTHQQHALRLRYMEDHNRVYYTWQQSASSTSTRWAKTRPIQYSHCHYKVKTSIVKVKRYQAIAIIAWYSNLLEILFLRSVVRGELTKWKDGLIVMWFLVSWSSPTFAEL